MSESPAPAPPTSLEPSGQATDVAAFEEAAQGAETSLVAEFIALLRDNKKWWLVPLLLTLFFVGVLVVLGGTAAAPFIYTLF